MSLRIKNLLTMDPDENEKLIIAEGWVRTKLILKTSVFLR